MHVQTWLGSEQWTANRSIKIVTHAILIKLRISNLLLILKKDIIPMTSTEGKCLSQVCLVQNIDALSSLALHISFT